MLYPVKDVLVWAQDLSVSIKGVFLFAQHPEAYLLLEL